jgi:two-component system response regulator LytT
VKVRIEFSDKYVPPYAVIYTDSMNEEVRRTLSLFDANDSPVIAENEDQMILLKPEEVYLVRVEGGDTVLYTKDRHYRSRRRLYELLESLGSGFMQISKQTVVNLKYIRSVDAGFSGTLSLRLSNGLNDYVSRKYLPDFKKYLGL